jgi:exopolysaccharide biosynthesis protein
MNSSKKIINFYFVGSFLIAFLSFIIIFIVLFNNLIDFVSLKQKIKVENNFEVTYDKSSSCFVLNDSNRYLDNINSSSKEEKDKIKKVDLYKINSEYEKNKFRIKRSLTQNLFTISIILFFTLFNFFLYKKSNKD